MYVYYVFLCTHHAEISCLLVREEINVFVRNYLFEQSQLNNTHPLDGVLEDLIAASVAEILKEVIKAAVVELVDDYLFFNNFELFLTETLRPVYKEIAYEAKYEITTEYIIDDLNDVSYVILVHIIVYLCVSVWLLKFT